MALNADQEKYHKLSPKDVLKGSEPLMKFSVVRTTNHTGEQIATDVPVYADDTREQLKERLEFAYSIIQDRLESENRAIAFLNERTQIIRQANEIIKRNAGHLDKKLSQLKKKYDKELNRYRKDADKMKELQEQFNKDKQLILDEFEKANEVNVAKAKHAQAEIDAQKELKYEGPEGDFQDIIADPTLDESEAEEEEAADAPK